MEYHPVMKKNKFLPHATTWIDLEGIMLSEISQTGKQCICYHLCVESKKQKQTKMNITKQKQTHRCREQTSSYWWGERSGEGQEELGLKGLNYYV